MRSVDSRKRWLCGRSYAPVLQVDWGHEPGGTDRVPTGVSWLYM